MLDFFFNDIILLLNINSACLLSHSKKKFFIQILLTLKNLKSQK